MNNQMVVLLLGLFAPPAGEAVAEKKAGQVYKNLQVLGELPASELQPAMNFVSGSLGVRCDHCHVNPFQKDAKPAKQTARKMMQMVFALNRDHFEGKTVVTCSTCHRGQTRPVPVPPLGTNLWAGPALKNKVEKPALPSAAQVLTRYTEALGGAPALAKVTSRVSKGVRIGADGSSTPEEVYEKAPNKLLVTTAYTPTPISTGFDGNVGWVRDQQGHRELSGQTLTALQRDADLYKDLHLKDLYTSAKVIGKTALGERDAYILQGTLADGRTEKLYFDAPSGLLLRRYLETATSLGPLPLQTDYEDYRPIDGMQLPFLIRWSMPGRTWSRKVADVKHNLEIEDGKFNGKVERN